MKVLVTGADGFIGKNLRTALGERPGFEVLPVSRSTTADALSEAISSADAVVHLAGVNRPEETSEFAIGNAGFTSHLCDLLVAAERAIPVVFSSSTQVSQENPYGKSKRDAEEALTKYAADAGAPVCIYRLPNVFGKWCRPNYNSVVATFCHNISKGLDIRIDDPSTTIQLAYVDDVVSEIVRFLGNPPSGLTFGTISPVYSISLGELAQQIRNFRTVRDNLVIEPVGSGLCRALYSTYVSYFEPADFSYTVPRHCDSRGAFVEMLKTQNSGQFSFFTAHPGVTRGGHYHHSKTEKFLVISGKARFKFRQILTNEKFILETSGEESVIVETIPGWAHDVTNIGDDEMVVMLWANEIFDRVSPDTIASTV